ncbi:ABC transporter ATP-binding protein [Campylobacterota bacterium]|nr:ABC transporter ATP-binding protein [Campylobacterota bacterium]
MLRAENISFSFDYPLFSNIDLQVEPRESIAILGVSGSGKSTLLHILASFQKPQQGRVIMLGEDLYSASAAKLGSFRRNTIGLIFQHHYLFRGFSALENLVVAALLSRESIDNALLERLGIAHILEQDAMNLSGGQQQRLSIARVLTKKPKLVFADEPTGNLDRHNALEVTNILYDYAERENAALFLVTHDETIATAATRAYRLENGALTQIK